MEFCANYMTADLDAGAWAAKREAQGWHVLGCADHLWTGDRPYPHVWVTLTQMACATSKVTLTTCFANNLFRSPVEFAQASLALQKASRGRFEAGLGAGWARDEVVGSALVYPEPRDRAGRFIEAIKIVRSLFVDGKCSFQGEYYDIEVPKIGPLSDPPPLLVASLGGPRTIREITPLVDQVEIKPNSPATRGGTLDFAALAEIETSHLIELRDRVRRIREDVPLGLFVLCSVGDDPRTKAVEAAMGDGLFSGWFGSPAKVADNIRALGDLGFHRIQLSPFTEESFDLLAAELL